MSKENKRYITVIKELEDGQRALATIDLDEVDFIDSDNRKIRFHIDNEVYYQITTISEFEDILEGFVPLDRPNLVNLRKVKGFDARYGKVYFVENPNPDSDFATVAKMKYQLVSTIIKKIISRNMDIPLEMEPNKESRGLKGLWEVFKS